MSPEFLTHWLASAPPAATPLLLACLGLIISERAGVISLGVEGYLAFGAMAAAGATLVSGHPGLGVLLAVLAGATLALGFGIAVVLLRCEQILAGLATMAIGLGAAGVLGRPYVHRTFEGIETWSLGPLAELPVVGRLLFAQDPLTYLAVLLTLLCSWLLFRTRAGLRLRAVGEDPATADVAGVNVQLQQLLAVVACGALAGLGGAYLALVASNTWVENMVGGRGWIALALVIFARWAPGRALLGALLFGAVEALLPRLQAIGLQAPVYLLGMLPYALTIAVLVMASVSRTRGAMEPAALGRAYLRQDRR